MLKLEASRPIRIEQYMPPSRANTGRLPLKIFIYRCTQCSSEIRVRTGYLHRATGLCLTCSNRKSLPNALTARRLRPYESRLRRLKLQDPACDLTYEDYVQLVSAKTCHYCHTAIAWTAYGDASTHYLDRKDNELPHLRSNVVACCGSCNRTKGDRFTYEEFVKIAAVIREIIEVRNGS